MGNNHGGFRLLSSADTSYNLRLKSVATGSKEKKFEYNSDNNETKTTWEVSYTGEDGLTCKLILIKTIERRFEKNLWEQLDIQIKDRINKDLNSFYDRAQTTEAGLLNVKTKTIIYPNHFTSNSVSLGQVIFLTSLLVPRKSTNGRGDVITETSVFEYGSGTRKGLIVWEWKKKRGDEQPFMGTVAHYYINNLDGDVGLSVVVKIRVSNYDGHLEFEVEGPVQHPTSALSYMFEEACRTKTWRTTMCAHCAAIQKQRRNSMFWQSESEDSDNFSMSRLQNRWQTSSSVLANEGAIKGNNNGNFSVEKFFYGGR
ncbi:uncharacterized protein LOC113868190 [Abrus precatorius]|uniref:Uncharacterized protein LOC113868190 n=1 Tax=Abrus precatorius TaxID=3816 RepID=A0A8B8LVN9_ABRPR|nr:uncharacterized protein LOC113868190 [Abrus precatorius]